MDLLLKMRKALSDEGRGAESEKERDLLYAARLAGRRGEAPSEEIAATQDGLFANEIRVWAMSELVVSGHIETAFKVLKDALLKSGSENEMIETIIDAVMTHFRFDTEMGMRLFGILIEENPGWASYLSQKAGGSGNLNLCLSLMDALEGMGMKPDNYLPSMYMGSISNWEKDISRAVLSKGKGSMSWEKLKMEGVWDLVVREDLAEVAEVLRSFIPMENRASFTKYLLDQSVTEGAVFVSIQLLEKEMFDLEDLKNLVKKITSDILYKVKRYSWEYREKIVVALHERLVKEGVSDDEMNLLFVTGGSSSFMRSITETRVRLMDGNNPKDAEGKTPLQKLRQDRMSIEKMQYVRTLMDLGEDPLIGFTSTPTEKEVLDKGFLDWLIKLYEKRELEGAAHVGEERKKPRL